MINLNHFIVNSIEELIERGWGNQDAYSLNRSFYYALTAPKQYPAKLIRWMGEEDEKNHSDPIVYISKWEYIV